MLSKFFNSLKPKPYSVQVLRDATSQSAVKRIKRTRTKAPIKRLVMLTLLLSLTGGGVASASAATAVTADHAQANIFTDNLCISSGADNAGSWDGGANVYATIGGRAGTSFMGETRKTSPSNSAYLGLAGTWGGSVAPSKGEFLTAYEKYGILYPVYDSWVPVYADKEVTIKQVDSSKGSYSTDDGKLPTKGDGNKLQPGDSPLTTTNIGSCLAILPTITSSISNIIAALPKFVMGAGIELYGNVLGTSISDESSILHGIGENIDELITKKGGLRETLFIPFLLPLILIGAIWVGYVGIVKRAASQAVQSTVWMIVAIAAGTVFLAQPTLISAFVDTTVAQVQKTINEAVLVESGGGDMCNIDGSGDSRETIRETKCVIWYSTIYTTWATGQFGEGINSSEFGEKGSVMTQGAGRSVLNNKDYQIYYGSKNPKPAASWPQFMADRQVTNKSLELSEVAWAQLSGADGATINSDWNGSAGMITSAILMFFAAGASSGVLFVYGFALLIYQLTMITAVLMSPFFFLFGIVPNWGRRVLMRYAEILTSLALKRIFTGLMLAFYLLFYNLVLGDNAFMFVVLKVLVIFALALFFIGARGKFMKMFTDNINFGGNKSIGLPGNRAAAVGAGVGAGLLGGGLIGGFLVGKKLRDQNKDVEGNMNKMKLEGGNPTADIKPAPRGPNTGDSGGGNGVAGAATQTVKVAGKAVNTAEDIKRVNDFVNKKPEDSENSGGSSNGGQGGNGSRSNPSRRASNGPRTSNATPNTPRVSTSPVSAPAGVGGAGPSVAPAAAMGGNGVMAGGAAAASGGAAVGGGAAAAASGGAAAASGATAAAAGGGAAAVGGGAAAAAGGAGAAAASGAAVGATAGSVVPVAGTAVGAVVGAAVVKGAQASKAKNEGDK